MTSMRAATVSSDPRLLGGGEFLGSFVAARQLRRVAFFVVRSAGERRLLTSLGRHPGGSLWMSGVPSTAVLKEQMIERNTWLLLIYIMLLIAMSPLLWM